MLYATIQTTKKTIGQAKSLRRRQTPGEKALWRKLRAKRFHGLKFRRQAPLGPYIVDFLCIEKKLIIEIDGVSHQYEKMKQHDRKRERYLREKEFKVIRFSNKLAAESTGYVLSQIEQYINLVDEDQTRL